MTKSDRLRTAVEKFVDELTDLLQEATFTQPHLVPVKPNNRPKLTKRDVLLIRQMKRNGETQAAIAETFDVNRSTISRIVRGIYW